MQLKSHIIETSSYQEAFIKLLEKTLSTLICICFISMGKHLKLLLFNSSALRTAKTPRVLAVESAKGLKPLFMAVPFSKVTEGIY